MNKNFKNYLPYFTMFLIIFIVVFMFRTPLNNSEQLDVKTFVDKLNKDEIVNLEIQSNVFKSTLSNGKTYSTYAPEYMMPFIINDVYQKMEETSLNVKGIQTQDKSLLYEGMSMFITIAMLVGIVMLFNNMNGKGIAKSKAKMFNLDDKTITFAEVAGLEEEKKELKEVVEFLKDSKKYKEIGSKIPKGVLLEGPPGTGKTYLAKAVAGEAGVPFFSISGSDFVEMFVGVGASRVRDLFAEAKKLSPCIVFIDEIDAIGKKRGNGYYGGDSEREQTLNQLLIEMDGFTTDTNIIIMAATNRKDVLDHALLRPGRFDRHITVGIPNIVEREAIIKVHLKDKKYEESLDIKMIAKATVGFTPADLANLVNEAGILAVRDGKSKIDMLSVDKAMKKITVGIEKKSSMTNEKERKLTAYHEAGHAIVAKFTITQDEVNQVTIIPRGSAGGFTSHVSKEDMNYHSKKYLEGRLMTLMGGRIGEELAMDDISSGASNDLEKATQIARVMVTRYAMCDDMPKMVYIQNQFDTDEPLYSEKLRDKIDEKTIELLENAYNEAKKVLQEHMDKLHNVAAALLEYETINGKEFNAALKDGVEGVRKIREANNNIMGSVFLDLENNQDDEALSSDSSDNNVKNDEENILADNMSNNEIDNSDCLNDEDIKTLED